MIVRLDRDVHPVLEVIGAVLRVDSLDLALVEKGEGTPCGCDLHRLEDEAEGHDQGVHRGPQ